MIHIASLLLALGAAPTDETDEVRDLPLSLRSEPSDLLREALADTIEFLTVTEPLQDPDRKPRHRDSERAEFSFGPAAGYIRVRDADRGTWFGGVQARVRFLRYLGIEGSITFHKDEFADGDVEVTTYPVQVTALLFPFPDSPVEPYALFGAGWYYTRFDFDDSIGGGDETDRNFGFHVGAGAQIEIGNQLYVFGDFRWIFMDEPGVDNSDIEDEEFDSWQVTLGLSIRF
jgi:outer membrane immunogenic protein